LNKFNWVPREKFLLHLKECEYRFNCRLWWEKMYNKVLKLLRNYSKAF
jgi:transposase